MRPHSKTRSLTPNKRNENSLSSRVSHSDLKHSPDSNLKCPLDDPDLGIISENDHKVGLCLCQFCTCTSTSHICPSNKLQDAYPRSVYQTKYNQDFKIHQIEVPLRQEPKKYFPNSQPMDLRTTHQLDFQPYKLQINKSKSARSITPSLKFNSTTTYKKEYPNWGPHEVDYHKRFQPPLRSTELPFKEHSTYKNSFRSIDSDKVELYKTDIKNLSAYGSTFSLGPKDVKYDETTHKREFQDYSNSNLTSRVLIKANVSEPLKTAKTHFITSNQRTYGKSTPNLKDPRLTKLKLSSLMSMR